MIRAHLSCLQNPLIGCGCQQEMCPSHLPRRASFSVRTSLVTPRKLGWARSAKVAAIGEASKRRVSVAAAEAGGNVKAHRTPQTSRQLGACIVQFPSTPAHDRLGIGNVRQPAGYGIYPLSLRRLVLAKAYTFQGASTLPRKHRSGYWNHDGQRGHIVTNEERNSSRRCAGRHGPCYLPRLALFP